MDGKEKTAKKEEAPKLATAIVGVKEIPSRTASMVTQPTKDLIAGILAVKDNIVAIETKNRHQAGNIKVRLLKAKDKGLINFKQVDTRKNTVYVTKQ